MLREGLQAARPRGAGRAREEAERKGGRGKRVGSRLERAVRGQVATRNQGTSEPPSSHARNLQLPSRDIHTLLGPMAGKRANEPMNIPSKNAPACPLSRCARVHALARVLPVLEWRLVDTRHFPPMQMPPPSVHSVRYARTAQVRAKISRRPHAVRSRAFGHCPVLPLQMRADLVHVIP